jgi:hypothetical protein
MKFGNRLQSMLFPDSSTHKMKPGIWVDRYYWKSCGSSVSIVTRLRAGRAGLNSHQRHHVQTGSGAHPAFCPVGTGALTPRVKRPEREADNWPPSSAEVNAWSCTSILPYVFMPWYLIKHRDDFVYLRSCWCISFCNCRRYYLPLFESCQTWPWSIPYVTRS